MDYRKLAKEIAKTPIGEEASANLSALMDASLKAKQDAQPKRDYLGGSRLGEDCLRRLGYEWHKTPEDGEGIPGRTYRIFQRGHVMEEAMAEWLRLAGFELVTHTKSGGQISWGMAKDRETGLNRIAGHLDGVVVGWTPPAIPGNIHRMDEQTWALRLPFPLLWECKALNSKNWTKLSKDGLKKTKSVYYAQCQIYMAMKDLNHTLFTALNADTMEVYAEVVAFDQAAAQEASDKGLKVILTKAPEELPRIAAEPGTFACRFCPFKETCWAAPAAADPDGSVAAPDWA
jgi:hypothetical protein